MIYGVVYLYFLCPKCSTLTIAGSRDIKDYGLRNMVDVMNVNVLGKIQWSQLFLSL
jgi:hypothetical protein